MINKQINLMLISCLTLTSVFTTENSFAQKAKNSYKCINNKGIPTTVVDTSRGRIQLIVWQSDFFRNSGWTPQKRCQEVTARFQKFSDSGSLRYVTTGLIDKKYPAICVGQKTPGQGYTCTKNGLLLTLQSDDNPNEVLKTLFNNAAQVGGKPVVRNDGNYVFPMEEFLNQAQTMEITTEENTPNIINNNEEKTTQKEEENSQECPSILCN
ncbi:MAG: hypothetical protein GW795_07200 [Cyanobacteria bacterium]|nr:hypothetical protein [Cyanobacteria bacterium CG_2015-22_32_23]NCQ41667.1 hypothetical protein [Cyanobacteria bacterium CG_2015-04_32_10]